MLLLKKDGIKSSPRCQDFEVKIDKTKPTCDIKVTGRVGAALLTVKVTENGSGISTTSSSYRNTADKTYVKVVSEAGSYSFSVKDSAGNIGGCSVKVTEQVQYSVTKCENYDYSCKWTYNLSSCTVAGTNDVDSTYNTCVKVTKYGKPNIAITCVGNDGNPVPTQYISVSYDNTTTDKAKSKCEELAKAKCTSYSANYAGGCSITYSSLTTYSKSTCNATACKAWGTASDFSPTKPSCANDNLTCKITTREVLAEA